jgi:hypothetical protein
VSWAATVVFGEAVVLDRTRRVAGSTGLTSLALRLGNAAARTLSRCRKRPDRYALQVVDYLNTTKSHVVTYQPPNRGQSANLQLHGYSDASFADCSDRKSTSGFLFKLAGATVSHRSAKQRIVTTSTTEAEYVAMVAAAKEATWLTRLLHQIQYNTA